MRGNGLERDLPDQRDSDCDLSDLLRAADGAVRRLRADAAAGLRLFSD